MLGEKRRSFSRDFKLAVIARLKAGESGGALAQAVRVKPAILHHWRGAWRKVWSEHREARRVRRRPGARIDSA
jgi:transposase-like protein